MWASRQNLGHVAERTSAATSPSHMQAHPTSRPANPLLNLQQTIGNQAVVRLMRAKADGGQTGSASGEGDFTSRVLLPLKPPAIIQPLFGIHHGSENLRGDSE